MKKRGAINKRAQVGIEYMILIGFITFAILSILTFSIIYSGQLKDEIRLNQVENFAIQLINSAESVFFAGAPSKTTIRLYLPDGVDLIEMDSTDYIIISTTTSSGINKASYKSKVPIIIDDMIPLGEGTRSLELEAQSDNILHISNAD
jgi:hypothetical protein